MSSPPPHIILSMLRVYLFHSNASFAPAFFASLFFLPFSSAAISLAVSLQGISSLFSCTNCEVRCE